MSPQGKIPLWKDILLTFAGMGGLAHETIADGRSDTGLIIVFASMMGLGIPALIDRYRSGGKGDE